MGTSADPGKYIGSKYIIRDNLVLYVDAMNRNSFSTGTTWSDLSGGGNDVILSGATHIPTGTSTVGSYFDFDGTNDYGYVKNLNYGPSNTLSNMTVCAWISTSESGGDYDDNWSILDFDRSEVFAFYIKQNDGKIGFSADDGTMRDMTGNTACNDGNWHFVCVTYSNSANLTTFYLDGEADGTDTLLTGNLGTGGSNRYGCVGDGSEMTSENGARNDKYYNGGIASIMFYETTLTESQIKYNFNVDRGRFEI